MSDGRYYCRKCFEENADYAEIREKILRLADSLDAENKADGEEYRRRLKICESCEKMTGGICGECGCFIELRAVKKRMHCPFPGGERW